MNNNFWTHSLIQPFLLLLFSDENFANDTFTKFIVWNRYTVIPSLWYPVWELGDYYPDPDPDREREVQKTLWDFYVAVTVDRMPA